MENASKALLIAGEVLIAILLITLLIYAWGKYQEYQASQEDLAEIEDTTEFNNQFANYDRDDVLGYELITLVNQVIDYNYRRSNLDDAKSNDKYPPVTVIINLGRGNVKEKLTYNGGKNKLFTRTNIHSK